MCKGKSIEMEGQGGRDSATWGLLVTCGMQSIVLDSEESRMNKTCSLLSGNFACSQDTGS